MTLSCCYGGGVSIFRVDVGREWKEGGGRWRILLHPTCVQQPAFRKLLHAFHTPPFPTCLRMNHPCICTPYTCSLSFLTYFFLASASSVLSGRMRTLAKNLSHLTPKKLPSFVCFICRSHKIGMFISRMYGIRMVWGW